MSFYRADYFKRFVLLWAVRQWLRNHSLGKGRGTILFVDTYRMYLDVEEYAHEVSSFDTFLLPSSVEEYHPTHPFHRLVQSIRQYRYPWC